MERLTDKLVLLVCCLAAAIAFAPRAASVAALCLCAAMACTVEVLGPDGAASEGTGGDGVVADGAGRAARRTAAIAVVLPLAYSVLPLAVPEALVALPLATYDLARQRRRILLAVPVVVWLAGIRRGALDLLGIAFIGCLVAAAALLAVRTETTRRQRECNRRERDRLSERSLRLEAQNRDLLDKRELAVRVAVLEERTRIAREIHDNVGHLLTRALLQVRAYQVVFAQDDRARDAFAALGEGLDEALSTVRASVRDLHDDRIDVGAQVASIVAEAPVPAACTSDVEAAPPEVASCLAAVTREALSNVAHHAGSGARAEVQLVEHPAFWQLTVVDDGGAGDGATAAAPRTGRGFGLTSMAERVHALGGSFRAGPDPSGPGWRVFASIPKPDAASEGAGCGAGPSSV